MACATSRWKCQSWLEYGWPLTWAIVGGDEALLRAETSFHLVDRLGHLGELPLHPPRSREGSGLSLEDPPSLEQLTDIRGLDREQELEGAVQRAPKLRDAEAAVGAAADDALRLQHAERLANRGPPDAVQVDELALRRDWIARAEVTGADEREQALGDELVRLLPRNRPVERLVRQADRL